MIVLAGAYWGLVFLDGVVADRRKTTKGYARIAKELRSEFRGFEAREGFDLRKPGTWTASQKAKITRKFKFLNSVRNRNAVVLHPRRVESRNRTLQGEARYSHYDKDAKKIYFPAPETANVKITFSRSKKKEKKDRVTVRVNRVVIKTVDINRKAYIKDPGAELQRVVDVLPKAKMYEFMVNTFASTRTYLKSELLKVMNSMRERYTDSEVWLTGIRAYYGPPAKLRALEDSKYKASEKRKAKLRGKRGQRRLGRIR